MRRQAHTEEKPVKDDRPDRPEKIAPKPQSTPQVPTIPEQNTQQQPILEKQNFQQPGHQQQQPNYQQQQPNYQQQQPNYYSQQQAYPQQQLPPNQFPFGIGFFGQPQFGFPPANPFGFSPIGN